MSQLKISTRLLLGRLLTKSGDQAWDFAVPLVLLKIYPDQLRIAALYYLVVKLMSVILIPRISSMIDRLNRLKAAKFGIVLQLFGVLIGAVAIYALANEALKGMELTAPVSLAAFGVLTLGGILSSLGSTFMDIAIANDLVPSSLSADELAKFNSRFRQVDLFTEVGAPVIAGFLLLLDRPFLMGFFLVAAWNVLSFLPELGILQSIFKDRPDLMDKKIQTSELSKKTLLQKLTGGWRAFFNEPIALASLAYAFLWLSVLSPHGVLLAAFLKDGWQLPEWAIGTFRGAGAFFGLLATILFPFVIRKFGLLKGTQGFIVYQALILILGLILFFIPGISGQIGFLICILLSRIGLYGFSLGEMQIRQIGINPNVRGEVNGFANALTGIATLFLYGAGALLPETADFKLLIVASVFFVSIGALTYILWQRKHGQTFEEYK